MKLTVIPIDKTIIVDGEGIAISLTDITWIPTDVHAIHWDSTTSTGEIEYNDSKPNAAITEIGIWQQAVTDHASEKTAIANAIEAARNHEAEVRGTRNGLLSGSDWTRLDDNGIAADKKVEWATYRQQLRDLPATVTAASIAFKALADDPNHSSWPTKPS